MISSIKIEGYRGFGRFEMENLGRVNLLVGTNNSGKTSLLEALYLLTTRGEPASLWQLLFRRGERSLSDSRGPRPGEIEFDVSHLFTGHEIQLGSKFSLVAQNESPELSLTFAVGKWPSKERGEAETPPGVSRLALHINGHPQSPVPIIPLSRIGGISPDALDLSARRPGRTQSRSEGAPSQFITTESLDGDDLVLLWNKVALTPNEGLVLRALKFLDPQIERIAAQASPNYYGGRSRSGFIVKLSNREQPIPIGSMGDGMWRMLAMAIAITQCRGGVLLVDEIDTGLHYTVMADMWKLVFAASQEFNVQVFATTHSYDCIESLARARSTESGTQSHITLQRIEAGSACSVPYSESEIAIAAEKGIEVR